MINAIQVQDELDINRRTVSFDTYDITVKQLYDMINEGYIDIAPEYQRHFIWDNTRQSQLIESIFLGIPVPSLYMATNKDSTWEVIDGVQRLTTIYNFISPDTPSPKTKISYSELKLGGLEKLKSMNGLTFQKLPKSIQFMFSTRSIRVTVLNDRSDYSVRYDLFERLNTGGISLHPQEIRNCVFLGKFNDFLKECAAVKTFTNVVKITPKASQKISIEELVLRFFAYYENYNKFDHSVVGFLNEYMEQKTNSFKNEKELYDVFTKTFQILSDSLPEGIVRGKRKNSTPIILFEAITVGTALAIREAEKKGKGKKLNTKNLNALLNNENLTKFTTGATNSKKQLLERLKIVKSQLL